MADQTLFTWKRVILRQRILLRRCCASWLVIAGCTGREPSDDERAFYRRAHSIKVGASVQDVRRLLDEPTQVVDAKAGCISPAAQKVWIYEDFVSNGLRKALDAKPIVFCVSADGKILQVVDIERHMECPGAGARWTARRVGNAKEHDHLLQNRIFHPREGPQGIVTSYDYNRSWPPCVSLN